MRNICCLNCPSRQSRLVVSVNALSILLLLIVNNSALLVASTRPRPAAQSKSAKLDEARRLADEATRLSQQGRYDEAIPVVERWLAIVEKVSGSTDPNVAIALSNLAGLHQDKGDYSKAEPLFQRALSIMEKALGPKHPGVAPDLNNLAVLYFYKGDYAKAEPPVSDEGTRDLMIQYYRGLKAGEGRSEALRQVQLKMLSTGSRKHPYYWASFIQSGEWANLDSKR